MMTYCTQCGGRRCTDCDDKFNANLDRWTHYEIASFLIEVAQAAAIGVAIYYFACHR